MAHFLLIHGSCHGAWCWRDVLPFLNTGGHTARAIDLPSHGNDKTPVAKATLEAYADAILAEIDANAKGPVVLVGHSMAGYPISAAAERAPEKIAKLVYLCAYYPSPDMSLADMRRAGPRQPLRDAIIVSPDGLSFTIDPAKARDKFYHDCPPEAAEYARRHLCPEPIKPQSTPVTLTDRHASVPKHYIRCTDDHTIPPEYQVTMSRHLPADCITEMACSHSPFFAAPAILAQTLIRIASL